MTDEQPTPLDQFRTIALTGFAIVAVVAIGALIHADWKSKDANPGYDFSRL
jgi:hypothetical protein